MSQWFLSFFGVTCPLPMLLRIYDVILTEGASETLMRVALSLMRRNERKIKACGEFEDVMHLLLSRELWDTYGCNADDLVNDFVGLTGLVTRERLEQLEASFRDSQSGGPASATSPTLSVQAAASGFLGRLWAGSNSSNKVTSPTSSLSVTAPSRPSSFLRRTPSKQSVASTLNSVETTESCVSTASTEATAMSRNLSADCTLIKIHQNPGYAIQTTACVNKDKDLHIQIEDLLTALGEMQREQNLLACELQKVREEREEDHAVVRKYVQRARGPCSHLGNSLKLPQLQESNSTRLDLESQPAEMSEETSEKISSSFLELEDRFCSTLPKHSLQTPTMSELQEDLKLWKHQYEIEATKSVDLLCQLANKEAENTRVLEQFREVRSRLQDTQKDKQKLEKTIEDFRNDRSSMTENLVDSYSPTDSPGSRSSANGGLREFKLGRAGSTPALNAPAPVFSKRSSSLGMQAVLATEDQKPLPDEALLLELVNAKTSEALARQELEEVKGKLDSLRKMLGGSPVVANGHRPNPSEPYVPRGDSISPTEVIRSSVSKAGMEGLKVVTPAASSSGGFFSGWGKRTVSTPVVSSEIAEV